MAERNHKDEAHKDEKNPEYQNVQDTLKKVLSVPKEKLDRRRAKEKWEKKEKRAG